MNNQDKSKSRPDSDEGLVIKVSRDRMTATVDLDVSMLHEWSEQRVKGELDFQGIVSGVDTAKIKEIFSQKLFNQEVEVAKGIPPQEGKDGHVIYHLLPEGQQDMPSDAGEGRVDHKAVDRFVEVEKGTLLAEVVEPVEGMAGKDVHGNPVPCKTSRGAKLIGGRGTRLSKDGTKLYSDAQGVLGGTERKLTVIPAVVVDKNVDYETGNICSGMTVVVKGDVLSGFTVKAGGDINVSGLVEASTLESDGSIHIESGIQGDGRAVLKAEGSITAKFASEATLVAEDDICIPNGVMQCNVDSRTDVHVSGERGVIVGGVVRAAGNVFANVIGSEIGAETVIEVGPELKDWKETAKKLSEKCQYLELNLEKLQQVFAAVEKRLKAGHEISEEKLTRVEDGRRTHKVLDAKQKDLSGKRDVMQAKIEKETDRKRYIYARDIIWPGTKVRMLDARLNVKNPMPSTMVTVIGEEIASFDYRLQKMSRMK